MVDPKPAAPAAAFPKGTILAGRFRVEGALGRGGMATVARVTDLATGRPLALKLLRPELTGRADIVERFRREGALLAALKHPTIVEIETFGKLEDGTMFLAMELLEGETLGARLRKGAMAPKELAPIVAAVCAGLDAAHARGIVHRDLKPENLFLLGPSASEPTEPPRVKILDFGIAKTLGSDRLTDTGEMLGTPRYMAPEQLTGESDLDARVDIYAMGAILYEALAGRPAFLEQSPSDLIVAVLQAKSTPLRAAAPHLPDDLIAVVSRAMAKPREGRFASARELGEAFVEAAGGITEARGRADLTTARIGSPDTGAPRTRLGMAIDAVDEPRSRMQEPLVPGTFSMPAVDVEVALATPVPPAEPDETQRVRSPLATPVERTPVAAVDRHASNSPFETVPATPSYSAAAAPSVDDEAPIPKPPRRSRIVWIVLAALLAGGLTAALVIAVLRFLDPAPGAPRGTPAAHAFPPAVASSSASNLATPIPTLPIAPPSLDFGVAPNLAEPMPLLQDAAADAAPDAMEPPPARAPAAAAEERVPLVPAGPTKHSSPRHRRDASTSSTSNPAPSPTSDAPAPATTAAPADPQTLPELLSAARRALARGDSAQCLAYLDRASSLGVPASALHLRGDCLRRAGRTDEAIVAYQRFCRLVPDHPAIGDVRGILESLGRTCP